MWTHEMSDGPVRREREQIYRERAGEILPALRILAQSKKTLLSEFGKHWLADYAHWVEHTTHERAA